jgi:hypothetical protein
MEYIPKAALKEWAVVCKALEEGRQSLLLRKGGIMEYRNGFEVKHNIFFLFPTFEHQSKEFIQSDYAYNLDIIQKNTSLRSKKNKINSYAKVISVREISDILTIQKLRKYHIWNDQYVNIRMKYNPKKPMSVVLLRVYKMNRPLEIDMKSEWAGCKSWIPISLFDDHQHTVMKDCGDSYNNNNHDHHYYHPNIIYDHRPALDDSKFSEIAAEIEKVLK